MLGGSCNGRKKAPLTSELDLETRVASKRALQVRDMRLGECLFTDGLTRPRLPHG
jgi:hypothetical protein